MDKFKPLVLPDYRTDLEALFKEKDCFVFSNFMYHNLCLDYAVVTTDRMIEVCYVESKEEYSRELATIGRAGKSTFKKHARLRNGEFIATAFYFLAPPRILTADEVPPSYGLITAGKKLEFKKEADFFEPEKYLTKSNYHTIAKFLARELYKK